TSAAKTATAEAGTQSTDAKAPEKPTTEAAQTKPAAAPAEAAKLPADATAMAANQPSEPPATKPADAPANPPASADAAKTGNNSEASPAGKLTEAVAAADKSAAKAGPTDASNLDNTGLKKSVTGKPAFATLADAAGQGENAAKAGTPDTQAQQDAAAKSDTAHAETDKNAAQKDKSDNATEIPVMTSGDKKAHIPQDVPVAESLTGADRVYRIWLASKGTADAARSEWDRLLQKYPSILKKATPDIREYYFNTAQGSIYRLFVGPFNSLEEAQKTCGDIHERYKEEFCRTVLN
ncbi:MAG TPA: SPOR domain-containing protein, partial [Dongiaceae bacterium]